MSFECAEVVKVLSHIDVIELAPSLGTLHSVSTACLALVSAALLVVGHVCLRPAAAALLGSGSFFLTFRAAQLIACEARVGLSVVSGLCVTATTLCLLRSGLIVIGAAAFGATAYVLHEGISRGSVSNPLAAQMNRGVVFWALIGVSSAVGAAIFHFRRERIYIVGSSMMGAAGACACLLRSIVGMPMWTALTALAGFFGLGVFAQTQVRKRLKSQRR